MRQRCQAVEGRRDPDLAARDNPKGSDPNVIRAGDFAIDVESVLEETNRGCHDEHSKLGESQPSKEDASPDTQKEPNKAKFEEPKVPSQHPI